MPSLLKDRATGRLGRLISALRPARAGPLPVQTGFPTSLADLFVKNHGRLRKPSSCASGASRRSKKRGAPPSPSPPPSPAPSPPASSPPSPSPSPPPAAVSPPTQPRPDLPPAAEPVCHAAGGSAFGLGLGFLALVGVVLSLSILVIWSRRVVAAVTVAALSLFLLEPIRSFSLRRRPRLPAPSEALDLGGRGYVSPIREVEAKAEPEPPSRSCSDLDRGTDVISFLSTEDTVEERSEAVDDSGSSRGKAKRRSWRKLIPRRLQKGRIRKEDADSSLSSSFRSESSDADIATVGGSATRATDRPDSRRGSGRHQADGTVSGNATRAMDHPDSRRGSGRHQAGSVADAAGKSSDPSGPRRGTGTGMDAEVRSDGGVPIGIDASSADRPVPVADGVGGNRLPFVAAVIVALVGLVAGKLPAVAFTVLFVSSLQRLSCRREGR